MSVRAGIGGDGGGGICAARHLANKGIDVSVCVTEVSKVRDAGRQQLRTLAETSARIIKPSHVEDQEPSIVIDALIGYSLHAPLRGPTRDLVEWTLDRNTDVVSLDLPSGVDADNGSTSGPAVKAIHTLTLALPKPGLMNSLSGGLYLGDIGIPMGIFRRVGIDYVSPFGSEPTVELRRVEG